MIGERKGEAAAGATSVIHIDNGCTGMAHWACTKTVFFTRVYIDIHITLHYCRTAWWFTMGSASASSGTYGIALTALTAK